ncbi:MAG: hypothetical protein LIO90_01690 [Bacteroidales bacterium]|nr:hypothetical protein [Bacteroidales bacterium]
MNKNYLLATLIALLLGVCSYVGVGESTPPPMDSEELLQNLEALSDTEWLFTSTCMADVTESTTKFEEAFLIRKCLPCGELVWATYAAFPLSCEN